MSSYLAASFHRTFSFAVLLACAGLPVVAQASLIGWWEMNGNANATVGTNGSLLYMVQFGDPPVPTTDRFGTSNGALSFCASRPYDHMNIPGGGGLAGLQTGTIAFWVNWVGNQTSSSYGAGAVLGRNKSGSYTNNLLMLNGENPSTAKIIWQPYTMGNTVLTSTVSPGANTWIHVALTFGDGYQKLYLNGTLDASTSYETTAFNSDTNAALTVGIWGEGVNTGYAESQTYMDDLRIYNTALSAGEVASLAGVPEPSTYAALTGVAVLGFAAWRRRKPIAKA